jgi:type IV pilus assembly protein PilC
VPLVESLDAVGGAAGNALYAAGTKKIQTDVSTGTSLTNAMMNTRLFPNMVLQMTQIGEESGSLDGMLGKVADFYEREVDDAVAEL